MEMTQELRASLPCGSSFFVESDHLCHCRAEWHRGITQNCTTYVSNCSDVSPKSSHVGFFMSRWSVFFKNEKCVELLSVTLAVNTTRPLVLDPLSPMSRDACGVVCAMSTLTKLSTFFLVFRCVSVRVTSDELVSHLRDFPQSVFAYCFSFLYSSFDPILISMYLSFVLRSSFCLGLQEQRALLNPSRLSWFLTCHKNAICPVQKMNSSNCSHEIEKLICNFIFRSPWFWREQTRIEHVAKPSTSSREQQREMMKSKYVVKEQHLFATGRRGEYHTMTSKRIQNDLRSQVLWCHWKFWQKGNIRKTLHRERDYTEDWHCEKHELQNHGKTRYTERKTWTSRSLETNILRRTDAIQKSQLIREHSLGQDNGKKNTLWNCYSWNHEQNQKIGDTFAKNFFASEERKTRYRLIARVRHHSCQTSLLKKKSATLRDWNCETSTNVVMNLVQHFVQRNNRWCRHVKVPTCWRKECAQICNFKKYVYFIAISDFPIIRTCLMPTTSTDELLVRADDPRQVERTSSVTRHEVGKEMNVSIFQFPVQSVLEISWTKRNLQRYKERQIPLKNRIVSVRDSKINEVSKTDWRRVRSCRLWTIFEELSERSEIERLLMRSGSIYMTMTIVSVSWTHVDWQRTAKRSCQVPSTHKRTLRNTVDDLFRMHDRGTTLWETQCLFNLWISITQVSRKTYGENDYVRHSDPTVSL